MNSPVEALCSCPDPNDGLIERAESRCPPSSSLSEGKLPDHAVKMRRLPSQRRWSSLVLSAGDKDTDPVSIPPRGSGIDTVAARADPDCGENVGRPDDDVRAEQSRASAPRPADRATARLPGAAWCVHR